MPRFLRISEDRARFLESCNVAGIQDVARFATTVGMGDLPHEPLGKEDLGFGYYDCILDLVS